MTAPLCVESLSALRSGQRVLADVSFRLDAGEVLAVIGPNGAGKTTLLETVVGLRRSQSGRVCFGNELVANLTASARVFSFMLDEAELPAEVRVRTLLHLAQRQSGASAELTGELIERLGLRPLLSARATELSRGERRRVALFDALCTRRPIIALDEPCGVFDPRQLLDILALLRDRAAAGHALLLSVHQMADAQKIATRFLLLRQGRAVALGTLAELQQRAGLPGASLEAIFLALLSKRPLYAGA